MSSFDSLFKVLKSETNKYLDVSNVFQKLQDSGYIKIIYDLFQQIFIQEKKFTYEEINKIIQMNPGKKINAENQLKLNGSIFKTNFLLISNIIIEKSFNETYSNSEIGMVSSNNSIQDSSPQQSLSKPKTTAINLTNKNHSNSNIQAKSPQSPNKIIANNSSHFNKNNNVLRNNPRLVQAKIPQGLSTSVVVTRNDVKAFNKKKQTNKNEVNVTNNSFLSQKNPKLNQSCNSFYSNVSPYNNLDSEFSYIGGKSTFSFSKEEKLKPLKDLSPGAKYVTEIGEKMIRNKSPEIKFDKAEKTSWFDDKHKKGNDSPGFIYNPSRHFTSK